MRKLVGVAMIFILVVAAAAVWQQLSGSKSPAPEQQAKKVNTQTQAKPWSGSAKRLYDVAYIHDAQEMDLCAISYTGLDHQSANAYVTLTLPKTVATPPAYARAASFRLSSPTGQLWLPTVTTSAQTSGNATSADCPVGQSGAYWKTILKFRGVPVDFLGQGQLELSVRKPGGQFDIWLVPPPAPAGHHFAEIAPKPKPKVVHHKAKAKKLAICKKGHHSTKAHPCRKR